MFTDWGGGTSSKKQENEEEEGRQIFNMLLYNSLKTE